MRAPEGCVQSVMDWTYPATDPDQRTQGIAEIAQRLVVETDDPQLAGTRFTYDAREMLRATRDIEESLARGGTLWVGFQRADKLDHEVDRYGELSRSGTEVVAFGTGTPAQPSGVRWVRLEPSTRLLENQWFLVTTAPEPIAFVSWEVSEPSRFGEGGISAPDKRFFGFVTDDRRVIDLLVAYLDAAADAAR